MKRTIAMLFMVVFLVFSYVAWNAISFLSSPASKQKLDIIFEVPPGASFYSVSKRLREAELIKKENYFIYYAKFMGQTTKLKMGEYKLSTSMSPKDVLEILTSGESVSYSLTIPEGHNIFNIRDQLNNMWSERGDEFYSLVTDTNFIKKLTGSDWPTLEGYLFPETYTLTKFTSMETLVRKMYEYFQRNIAQVNIDQKVQLSLRDQVILASVIEKETGAPHERQMISSVFHNRLKKGMKLQSDPTILYGMFVRTGIVTKSIGRADILAATPFNTYTVKALPLGPIANPGREALHAAVNPIDSNNLYFVSRNDGTHVFSETYAQHNKAVKDFQLNRNAREGKSWRDLNKKSSGN